MNISLLIKFNDPLYASISMNILRLPQLFCEEVFMREEAFMGHNTLPVLTSVSTKLHTGNSYSLYYKSYYTSRRNVCNSLKSSITLPGVKKFISSFISQSFKTNDKNYNCILIFHCSVSVTTSVIIIPNLKTHQISWLSMTRIINDIRAGEIGKYTSVRMNYMYNFLV